MKLLGPVPAWSVTELPLDDAHARELAATRLVGVEPIGEGMWRIGTRSAVGSITGDGWELRIRPRLAVPKLLFLLAHSANPRGWQDVASSFAEADDLVEAIASGFAWHAEQTLEQGLLRGYVSVDEQANALRGRIRFADQIGRSAGLPLPLELTFDDYTADIVENRMLLTAAEILVGLPRVPATARRRLLRVRAILDGVATLADVRDVALPETTRANARYSAALTLAVLVLRSRAKALAYGTVSSTTFLFDMNEVFESFVFAALTDAFKPYGGLLVPHHREWLDLEAGLQLVPDVTWWPTSARCAAVIDAKYKSLFDRATMPNADAYQVLAYCIGLGVQRGYLIYAKDDERTRFHTIRRHGYEIAVHALDVEQEPAQLLQQVDAIAREVAQAQQRDAA